MNSGARATLSAVTASILLLAALLMGVESVREEAAPVEQYNDSGETVRQNGVLYPTSLFKSPLDEAGFADADQREDNVALEINKRAAWNNLQDAWGKRQVLSTRDGLLVDPEAERTASWNRLFGMVGKRGGPAGWSELNGYWGKRTGLHPIGATDGLQWSSLGGGWGKRGWNDLSTGYGKRYAPHWNNLRGMWGRK